MGGDEAVWLREAMKSGVVKHAHHSNTENYICCSCFVLFLVYMHGIRLVRCKDTPNRVPTNAGCSQVLRSWTPETAASNYQHRRPFYCQLTCTDHTRHSTPSTCTLGAKQGVTAHVLKHASPLFPHSGRIICLPYL